MIRHFKTVASVGLAALLVGTLPPSGAQDASAPRPTASMPQMGAAVDNMASTAMNFWAALTPEQQAKAGFPFDSDNRLDWHYIPRERKGLTWNDMTSAQQALAHAFLASGLSTRGYQQAVTIMSLDQILKEIEKGKGPRRDPNNYAFSIFGAPADKGTWGWRVEGHHLSMNFTIADGHAVAGPVFFGTNPAEVREGPRKGLRVLAVEEDMGFALVNSLNDEQKKLTVIEVKAPKEIITGNSRKANPGPPVGITFAQMTPEQKTMMTTLVGDYAHRLRPELAEEDLSKIEKAGWDNVHFAWAGAMAPGEGHYYRIHGPTFLVEFDNTQNNANHVHTVWRDSANDFGEDLLKEHYDQTKH